MSACCAWLTDVHAYVGLTNFLPLNLKKMRVYRGQMETSLIWFYDPRAKEGEVCVFMCVHQRATYAAAAHLIIECRTAARATG